jgi:hypothetical protein
MAPEDLALLERWRAIASTKVVRTHRLRFEHLDEIDDAAVALVAEAHETVGPGLR